MKNRNRLLKISHVSAKIIGLPTPKLSEIIDHAVFKKARAVATVSDHPLSTFFHVLPSQRRYRCIKCKSCRYSSETTYFYIYMWENGIFLRLQGKSLEGALNYRDAARTEEQRVKCLFRNTCMSEYR